MNEARSAHLPHKIFLSFLVIFVLGFSAGRIFPIEKVSSPPVQNGETSSVPPEDLNFRNFRSVWKILQEKYVHPEKFNQQKMMDGAVSGFVAGLGDPFTVYLNKEDSHVFEESLNSQLEGIGAELEMQEGLLVIVSLLKNSPASNAGLQAEDIITKINGESTEDMALYEAVTKIRGKAGSRVTLTIFRKDGGKEPAVIDVTITRSKLEIESVTYEVLPEKAGLITINQFSDDTAQEFQKKINEILLNKPAGLILDLRGNGGGYLDISIDIISEFISGKKIAAKIKSRIPEQNEEIFTHDTGRIADIPLVVLVNGGSASASEIVAGAIQDYKRGLLFGEKTFGKGTVQEIENLEDGSSLRLTVAEWLTPLGRSIHEVGITPDRLVEFPKDTEEGKDPQLDAAVQYLQNLKN